jgi:hypothetical protein
MIRIRGLLVLAALMVSLLSFGQKYVVTPEGLRDSSNSEKTYLVISCVGKSAKELYDNAFKYINQNYKNPDEVIKGHIESEYLSFETFSPSAVSFKRSGGRPTYNLKYRTEMHFKDGKVKYEIQNVEMETDGHNLYFSGNPLIAVAIYNHKGELKYEEAKTKVENYFNSVILVISQFLNGSKVEDKW